MKKKNLKPRQYRPCSYCKGTGKIKVRLPKLDTPDCKRMREIMTKYNFTQFDLAKVLGIAQATISDWFYAETNSTGKIKKLYFTLLKHRGFI